MQALLVCPSDRSAQLDESDVSTLCAWSDILEAWVAQLEDAVVRWNGVRYVAQQDDVTFLGLDDVTHREQIEDAVALFTRTSSWPKLSFNALRLLLLRAFCASRILSVILDDKLQFAQAGLPTDLGNRPGMIRWLFLDTWKMTASESRRLIIADFVESRLSTKSSPDRETDSESETVAV